jgi:hypothetical protein
MLEINYVLSNAKQGISKTSNFLICSVADVGPESGAFLTPGSGIRDGEKIKDPDTGSRMNILNHIFESLETMF